MLQLPEFFGYEIKFQTIQEVTRRGRHRFTLKMLLRSSAAVVSYWRKGKLNKKNLCTPSNAKNIGAIAKKKPIQAGKNFFEKKFMPVLKFPTLPITYLMVRPLVVSLF